MPILNYNEIIIFWFEEHKKLSKFLYPKKKFMKAARMCKTFFGLHDKRRFLFK